MRVCTRSLVAVAAVVLAASTGLVATAPGAAAAHGLIRPGQHFVGLVNGQATGAVVYTVCPGPSGPGRTGPIVGSQTVAVRHVASGGGYTGLFSGVYVWFVQDASVGGPQQTHLTSYRTPVPVPAGVSVPCDGVGQVEFSSCPHLAPCAFGWVPQLVTVTFVNLAV